MADSLSPAIIFSWLIAILEAKRSRYPAVEPEHMLIGICSLDKFVDDPDFTDKIEGEGMDAIRTEKEAIDRVLSGEGWDSTHLRRSLRKALGKGTGIPSEDGVYHRSAACRRVFDAVSAAAGDTRPGTTIDFLVAATASPTPIIRESFPDIVSHPSGWPVDPPPPPRIPPGSKRESRDVFISYSAERDPGANPPSASEKGGSDTTDTAADGEYVRHLVEFLEKNHVRCWYAPRDIRSGDDYPTAIMDGIRSCRIMVVVISPRTKQKGFIVNEVTQAIGEGLVILPLLLEEVTLLDGLRFLFGARQRFYASSRDDGARLLALRNEISHHLSRPRE